MKISLTAAGFALIVLATSTSWGQITKGIAGNQTQVPGTPGGVTYGGLLGRPGNAPAIPNVNPGEAKGNPSNPANGANNGANGAMNPFGALGMGMQLPNANSTNGNGMTMSDIMKMRMLQSMGRNRGPQTTGGPIFAGNGGGQPGMNPGPAAAANNNQALPLFNAKAEKEAEKAKARQRAEDIRTKEAEAREKRKAKTLEAKKKAEEAKEAEAEAK